MGIPPQPKRTGSQGSKKWDDPELEHSVADDDGLKALKSRLCNIWSQIQHIEELNLEMRKIVAAIKAYNSQE